MKNNTLLCIDLKTKLKHEVLMKPGKEYPGILRRDEPCEDDGFNDDHYTFIETLSPTSCKRNPRIFEGQYITVTCKDNGELHPNFKHIEMGKDFCIDSYAIGVSDELRQALKSLIEK